jgi:tRNA A-37 threonylcarbamoyl transferase component Bud32
MAEPATGAELLTLVQRSGLLLPKQLDPYLAAQPTLAGSATDLAVQMVKAGVLTPFQVNFLLTGRFRGLRLGPYRLLERIGEGGMGEVYLAEHMTMRRRVAIKVLPPNQAADAANVERFLREARAVAQLNHPNIVRAFDIGHDAGVHFLALEYIQGRGLNELVKDGALPIDRAANYIAQAALGLQHAFENGLVHRDIKPANLLVDKRGIVRVLDLGLARFFDDRQDNLTRNFDKDMILGTVDYIAPEQAHDSSEVDIRADIYSLGVTFYELLTGQIPFRGSATQKIVAHQRFDPKPVLELRPEVPPGLAAVVARMMAKDPDERFATPVEVALALQPWAGLMPANPASGILAARSGSSMELPRPASGVWEDAIFAEPVLALPVAPAPALAPPAPGRWRGWWWLGLGVGIFTGIGLVIGWWPRPTRPVVPTVVSETPPQPSTYELPKDWYNNGFGVNPYVHIRKPLWALGTIWPTDLTKAENYRWFPKQQADRATFFDPANAFGGNPHGILHADGRVSMTTVSMRSNWTEGKDGPRRGTLHFIAPHTGIYSATGKAFAKRWEGEGPIQLLVVAFDSKTEPVRKLLVRPIQHNHTIQFTLADFLLVAGGQLVWIHDLGGHHSQGDCLLHDLVITYRPESAPPLANTSAPAP